MNRLCKKICFCWIGEKTIDINSLSDITLCFICLLPPLLKAQVRHPHEMHIDFDEDEPINWKRKTEPTAGDCSSYYRRLVKHLFENKKFQRDPVSDHFIANVPLRLKKEQYELLEQNVDGLNLNELDDLIADVLKQSNDEDWDYPVAQILLDHYRHQLIESLPSINSPATQIIIAVLIIVFISRMFHFSKLTFSALILFILMTVVTVSYSMTYYDCLNDLEVEQMIQLSKQQSTNNPCKDYQGEHESFWSSMHTVIMGSSENKCLEHMRKTFKTSKKFCDPLDVFAQWFGKIQMSYFSTVFGGFFEMISSMGSSSNILTRMLLYVVGAVVFAYLVLSFGTTLLKQGCAGIFKVFTTTRLSPEPNSTNQSNNENYQILSSKMDELLHENRQLKREVSIIRECSEDRTVQRSSPPRLQGREKLSNINEESSSPETK